MEQLAFDFERNWKQSYDALDGILFSSGWSRLDYPGADADIETQLLFCLLQRNVLRISEQRYIPSWESSRETDAKAIYVSNLLRKREPDGAVSGLLALFGQYEPEPSHTRCNALYLPGLRAYIRCGDLRPHVLIELLTDADCDKVLLFQSVLVNDTECAYYTIEYTGSKEKLAAFVQDEKFKANRAAMEQVMREYPDLFPPVD